MRPGRSRTQHTAALNTRLLIHIRMFSIHEPTNARTYVLNTQAYRSDAHTYVTSSQYTRLLMHIRMLSIYKPTDEHAYVCATQP